MLVDAGAARLWVEQRGQGPDLVLLCGLGDTHLAWSAQLETFAVDHRVTAIDNRGAGRSSLPDGPFSVADMAADAAGALRRLGIAHANVAGFSMGGAIAQELALARPDLVASLILVGTWCRTDGHQRALFESWKRLVQTAADDEGFVRSLLLWVYSRRSYRDGSIERWIGEALGAEVPQSTDAYLRTVDAILAHDTAERLEAITVPALVIAGEEDLICPPDVQRAMARRLRAARLELLPGEAHQPFQESPEQFDRLIREFLAAHEP